MQINSLQSQIFLQAGTFIVLTEDFDNRTWGVGVGVDQATSLAASLEAAHPDLRDDATGRIVDTDICWPERDCSLGAEDTADLFDTLALYLNLCIQDLRSLADDLGIAPAFDRIGRHIDILASAADSLNGVTFDLRRQISY